MADLSGVHPNTSSVRAQGQKGKRERSWPEVNSGTPPPQDMALNLAHKGRRPQREPVFGRERSLSFLNK